MKRFSVVCLAYFTVSSVLDVFPILNSLPVKLGNLSMIPPILFSVYMLFRKFSFHYAWFFIIPLLIFILPSVGYNEYDTEKLTKLLIMILTLSFTVPYLLNDNRSLRTYFNSISVFGVIIAVYSLFFQEQGYTRLVIADSNPIWMSRTITFGLFWLFLLFFHKKIKAILFLPLAILMIYVMVATGSKGPLFAFLLAIVVSLHKPIFQSLFKQLLKKRVLLGFYFVALVSIPLTVFFYDNFIESDIVERYIMFFTGEYEESARKGLMALSVELIKTHPLGVGLGGFAIYSPMYLYPHNLILEGFAELGWVFGSYLTLVLIIVLISFLFLQSNRTIEEQAILGFYFMALANSMVSGNLISPKELYISIPIGITLFVMALRQHKVNRSLTKPSAALLNSNKSLSTETH